ncbi:MAG: amidohydrolase family protein, partial [Bacteroidota bacterium]
DAWNWEDAVYKMDDAIHLDWPAKSFGPRWWLGETNRRPNTRYQQVIDELKTLFAEAKAYSANPAPVATNLKLDAMKGIFDGSKAVFLYENSAKGMLEGVKMLKENGVKRIIIVGGGQAMLIKDFLLDEEIPIVVNGIHELPDKDHEDTRYPYKLPMELHEAGIKYCIGYPGVANARNLAFTAGTTVAYGVPYEDAVKSISSTAAEILGISDRVGTIENGKDATLFISEGDALDMRTNKLTHAFIQGREVQLDARQQWLYEKYAKKYGHDLGK